MLWFLIITFNAARPWPKAIYCNTSPVPRLGRLPGLVDRATGRLGGLPHLSCKRKAEKIKVYVDRRVTPPPCKDNGNVKEYVTPKYNSAIWQVFWDYSVLLTNSCTVRANNYPVAVAVAILSCLMLVPPRERLGIIMKTEPRSGSCPETAVGNRA